MYLYSTPNVQTEFILETPDYDTEPAQLGASEVFITSITAYVKLFRPTGLGIFLVDFVS